MKLGEAWRNPRRERTPAGYVMGVRPRRRLGSRIKHSAPGKFSLQVGAHIKRLAKDPEVRQFAKDLAAISAGGFLISKLPTARGKVGKAAMKWIGGRRPRSFRPRINLLKPRFEFGKTTPIVRRH